MNRSIKWLQRPHASQSGTPIISHVDLNIFRKRYFTYCLNCTFCHDACCTHGVDVDVENVERINAYAEALEKHTGVSRSEWFSGDFQEDAEFAGGQHTRTVVIRGGCAFLNGNGRGCLIHNFCVDQHIDYHALKPMVCCLFPVTFDGGLLHPASEIDDGSLICINAGPTLYEGARSEILYYFGSSLIAELDTMAESLRDAGQ